MKVKRFAITVAAHAVAISVFAVTEFWADASARAADIHLLSAAAMQSVLKDITGDFERASGHRLVITYATMGAITQRLLGGESADLVIGSTPSVASLVGKGKLRADSQLTICKVGVGVVVPAGNPKFRIASVEDFKRALLDAPVVVYADPAGGGAAGIHVARVIEKLGLAEQLKSKTRFGAGGDVTEVTLTIGGGALGMTQISEIVEKRDADFVGPLPAELQNYTGVSLGIPTNANKSEAVAAFIDFLNGPIAIASMTAKGMEPN
jgi:molybdate transport system substrate-binding protein